MTSDSESGNTVLYGIHITYEIDPDGKPLVHTSWDDEVTEGGFVQALGMLELAKDTLLRAAFGRDEDA